MYLIVEKFVEALTSGGNAILSADRVGSRKPAAGIDVPAVVVQITLETAGGAGLGRFVRAGDSITRTTNIVVVQASLDTFSKSLKSLRISPLPLKKNPSSGTAKFTADDIQVRNVTNLSDQIDYGFAEQPSGKAEYKINAVTAEIIFGSAQSPGEKLEVTHWTVSWRDEILGNKYSGNIGLEVWADSFNLARDLSRRLQEKLQVDRVPLRTRGFLSLQPRSLGSVESVSQTTATGSTFPAWKQTLEYKFAFEAEDGGEVSSGIPIKHIDVDMDDYIVEEFSIT
jgi:hypothetical protein